jgi:hypothetical protein
MRHLTWPQSGVPRLLCHVGVFSAYLVVALVLTLPVACYFTSHIPIVHHIPGWVAGDGDPWHVLWTFWFVQHSLVELGRLPFSTDILFYPRGTDLMYLSLIVLPLLLALLLVQFVSLITAYNLLLLLSLAGAGYGVFLLVHDLTHERGPAFTAGLVFAFSPYHMAHALEHLFLLLGAVWLPLYVLGLSRSLREGRPANIAYAAGFFLLTLLSNPYYAVYLMLFTAFYGLLQICWAGDAPSRSTLLRRLGLVIVCCVVTAMPLVIPVSLADWSDTRLYMSLADANIWSADLLAFFVPSALHPLWGGLVAPIYARLGGYVFEHTVYAGYSVLALSGLAIVKGPRARTRSWAWFALLFCLLSLGPFLHVYGVSSFTLGETTFRLPMPHLLLHYLPIVGGARAANRFDVMLMLSLAILTGCGVQYLLHRLRGRWGGRAQVALSWTLSLVILCEFATLPLPILDARIPTLYEEIGRSRAEQGSLVEVPLDIWIAKYQYYQTAHGKRRLTGFGPRPVPSLIDYGDMLPFIEIFKHPDRVRALERSWGEREARRFIDLFDVDVIVLHREYLPPGMAAWLEPWLAETFPVERVDEDGSLVALWMQRSPASPLVWEPRDYRWDFAVSEFPPFLAEGWVPPETSGDLTFAWAAGQESRLWVFLPTVTDMRLELGLLPFSWPGGPPQGVTIYINEQLAGELHLEEQRWGRYALHLSRTLLTTGVNTFRFVYRYTASPAAIWPGHEDARQLAVAFDFIALRAE